jgi:hypothetical protein
MEKYIGTARNVRELQELLSKVSSSATITLSTNQWPEPLVEICYDAEIDDVLIK